MARTVVSSALDPGWHRWFPGRPAPALPEAARARLFEALGAAPRDPVAPAAGAPALPEPVRLEPPCRASSEFPDRLRHAAGMSTPDLIAKRTGRLHAAPDVVAWPRDPGEAAALLAWAEKESVAVVPFGGGTSVVGGVTPLRGAHRAVVSLDLTDMAEVLEIDETSRLVRARCGVSGPALERALAARGFTLGHFPQSFERSTLGGWIATRSAGQCSTAYGRIEDMVRGLCALLPAGEFRARTLPASASGPELREVLVGSEGTLGVLVEATLRIHALPEHRAFASFLLPDFGAGIEAARRILQEGLRPAVLRLSDETETSMLMTLSGSDRSLGARLLRWTGRGRLLQGCHLLVGLEGDPASCRDAAAAVGGLCRSLDGTCIGRGPGRRWLRERFATPALRDTLLDLGIVVDTLETATTWKALPALYDTVRAAIATPVVMCHLSHAYLDGASLYFTFLADRPDPDAALAEWRRVKDAATEAIVTLGATVSHHHGVGIEHRRWLGRERGEAQLSWLRACKAAADPGGILNPGKLLEEARP